MATNFSQKIKQLLKISCVYAFCSDAMANGAITGKVVKIAIDRTYTQPKVFITVQGDKTNIPSCHTNTSWSFALPLQSEIDKAVFSMLLSAHATGKTATLEGKGLCDVHSSIETLTYANY